MYSLLMSGGGLNIECPAVFGGNHLGMLFFISISVFDEIKASKQNISRWDAAFCSVTSGAILFAYVP